MASDPAFLFYPGDYLKDTQCLSEQSQVAYDRIMCEHMRNICITQERLNFFTKRLNVGQKKEIMSVLSKIPGGFEITWVADSLRKRRNYSDSRRKNREGKVSKGKEHMNIISKSYVPHMENANEIVNTVFNKELAKVLNKKYEAGADRGMDGIGQDVDALVLQMKSSHKTEGEIMEQAQAMKVYYQKQEWPLPTNYIKLLTAMTQTDWPQKLKELDPDHIANNIAKHKNGKGTEIDTIGTSAPGSLG